MACVATARMDWRILGPQVVAACYLTGVAADAGAMERAQAFACAHVQRAVSFDPAQLNAIR